MFSIHLRSVIEIVFASYSPYRFQRPKILSPYSLISPIISVFYILFYAPGHPILIQRFLNHFCKGRSFDILLFHASSMSILDDSALNESERQNLLHLSILSSTLSKHSRILKILFLMQGDDTLLKYLISYYILHNLSYYFSS